MGYMGGIHPTLHDYIILLSSYNCNAKSDQYINNLHQQTHKFQNSSWLCKQCTYQLLKCKSEKFYRLFMGDNFSKISKCSLLEKYFTILGLYPLQKKILFKYSNTQLDGFFQDNFLIGKICSDKCPSPNPMM